jgi:hypothetical protein
VGKKLSFVDQTLEVAKSYGAESGSDETEKDSQQRHHGRARRYTLSEPGEVSQDVDMDQHRNTTGKRTAPERAHGSSLEQSQLLDVVSYPLHMATNNGLAREHDYDNQMQIATSDSPTYYGNFNATDLLLSGSPTDFLNDAESGALLSHFVGTLGPSLDFHDSHKRLSGDVLERALICPPIMQLVLVASSKHILGIADTSYDAAEAHMMLDTLPVEESSRAAYALLLRFLDNTEGGRLSHKRGCEH